MFLSRIRARRYWRSHDRRHDCRSITRGTDATGEAERVLGNIDLNPCSNCINRCPSCRSRKRRSGSNRCDRSRSRCSSRTHNCSNLLSSRSIRPFDRRSHDGSSLSRCCARSSSDNSRDKRRRCGYRSAYDRCGIRRRRGASGLHDCNHRFLIRTHSLNRRFGTRIQSFNRRFDDGRRVFRRLGDFSLDDRGHRLIRRDGGLDGVGDGRSINRRLRRRNRKSGAD